MQENGGGLTMKLYDRITLNFFLNLFSSEVLFLVRYRGVTVCCTSNLDNKNLSFYYRFYVREYRFYPEGKFATVDIDD